MRAKIAKVEVEIKKRRAKIAKFEIGIKKARIKMVKIEVEVIKKRKISLLQRARTRGPK